MKKIISLLIAVVSITFLSGCLSPSGNNFAEKKENAQIMREDAVKYFIKSDVRFRDLINNSAGYAIVNGTGVDIFLLSSESGWGVLYSRHNDHYKYIKLYSIGAGLGLGVRDFRSLYVFDTVKDIQYFLEHGWFLGAQANAALKFDYGGAGVARAYEITRGIRLYKLNKSALILHATIQGTKIWENSDLNDN